MFEQAEEQRRIGQHLDRSGHRLPDLKAARLDLAGAVHENAVEHLRQFDAFVRLAHAPARQTRKLLALDADLARALDILAQRAQAEAVDATAGGERDDAFQRRGQRRSDPGADLAHERAPALELGGLG